ncbi:hypothetical protein RN001_013007 [Aquatica leii]|uniref:Protein phosphatase 1 regulatory subunit 35 C-terminal domain-containing protein n=1 Tax=Aquatica leii TaxID=1421715 RepID=A0AAN7SC64_9COLE|nr:hypothetical protein RN001_013007 [Aquatica leii]
MDKPVKTKNLLKRNPELTQPKNVVIKDSENVAPEISNICLNEPELNSALKIVKQIESVNKLKLKKSSIADLGTKKHIVLEEKASKQVNFPHHQKLYKDLIPLCVNTQPQPLPPITRDYQIVKDEEPVLTNFYAPKKLPEYSFQVSIPPTKRGVNKQYDGFKIYRTMKNWN